MGKRVSFLATEGAWAEYATASTYFVIDEDVPVASAASGIINPLTVLGFIHNYRKNGYKGIIHTAAASSVGRMLNRLCQTEKIPLLNVVRRKEQADLLKAEGAELVIVTEGDWYASYSEKVKTAGFDVLFNNLGGGKVVEKLIEGLQLPASVYTYGTLTNDPFTLPRSAAWLFLCGLKLDGYTMLKEWATFTAEEKKAVADKYSQYLKGDLATKTSKEYHFKDIKQALEASKTKATQGKVLLRS